MRSSACCICSAAVLVLTSVGCVRAGGALEPTAALADASEVAPVLTPQVARSSPAPEQRAADGSRERHQLLDIDPYARPYRVRVPQAYVAEREEYVSRVRICVTESGEVEHVEIIRPSIPALDEQLPEVIARWHYRPYVIEGQATAFCYPLSYRIH